MELKHVTLDTDSMTYAEVNELVQDLRAIRNRKHDLHARIHGLKATFANMKDEGMVLVSKYTGEVFNLADWTLYDERSRSFYPDEKEDEE